MPPDAEVQQGQNGVPPAPPPAPQAEVAKPPATNGEPEHVAREGKSLMIPQHAMKRIKEEERAKGTKMAMDALVKELGFSDIAAMKAALARPAQQRPQNQGKQQKGKQAQPPPQQATGNPRWEREKARLAREKEQIAKRMALEARQRRKLQRALDAREAEMILREQAVKSGVRDLDYAIRLLQREIEGKSEQDLKSFDESKFFEGLRGSHPYLFGEVTRPANTGTGAGTAPPPPKPGSATQEQAKANQVDAMKMSREEFQQYLRQKGWNA